MNKRKRVRRSLEQEGSGPGEYEMIKEENRVATVPRLKVKVHTHRGIKKQTKGKKIRGRSEMREIGKSN